MISYGELTEIIILYLPVIHQGYLNLLKRYPNAAVLILDEEFINEFPGLRKDLRALKPKQVEIMLKSLDLRRLKVRRADQNIMRQIANRELFPNAKIIMPDEDICHELEKRFFRKTGNRVVYESGFLRYDSLNSLANKSVVPDAIVTIDKFHQTIMWQAYQEAGRSFEWWRQIGAIAIISAGKIIAKHNERVPDVYDIAYSGDPRSSFEKGTAFEFSCALHAEAAIIAFSADKGICLRDSSLYVTTFPCPPCAKLVAYSGIRKIFFAEGYSVTDAEYILRERGIEVIQVRMPETKTPPSSKS